MKTHSIQLAAPFLLLIAILWGCQKTEQPELKPPQIHAAPSACIPLVPRWFDLDPISKNGAHYAYDLETSSHPFKLTECFCKVRRYELEFDSLPDSSKISVEDENGNPVPFSIVTNPQTGKVSITIHSDELVDGDTKIYVTIDENPVPPLIRAGGLCIVDNLGGLYILPDTTVTHYAPVFFTDYPPASAPIPMVIIPKKMTSPYHNTLPY